MLLILQGKHAGEKNYKCDECNKTFGHAHSLKIHFRDLPFYLTDAFLLPYITC